MSKLYLFFTLLICFNSFSIKAQDDSSSNAELASKIVYSAKQNIPNNYSYKNIAFELSQANRNTKKIIDYNLELVKSSFHNKIETNETQKAINTKLNDFQKNKNISDNCTILSSSIHLGDSLVTRLNNAYLHDSIYGKSIKEILRSSLFTAVKQIDTSNTYKVKSGLFKFEDSLSIQSFIHQKNDSLYTNVYKNGLDKIIKEVNFKELLDFEFIHFGNNYNYAIKEVTRQNQDTIYNISFSPKSNKASYKGNLLISSKDFAFLKISYQLTEKKKGKGVNLKFLMGIKSKNLNFKKEIVFQKLENATYFPSYISIEEKKYMYINRPIKLKANETNDKVKIQFLIEATDETQKQLLFKNIYLINNEDFQNFETNTAILCPVKVN